VTVAALPIPGVRLARLPQALHLSSAEPLQVLSSAVAGAALAQTCHILNMSVPRNYRCDSPAEDLAAFAQSLGIGRGAFVGMMTAARLERAQVIVEQAGDIGVAAIVTVGISRPVAAGTGAASATVSPGTINIILLAQAQLTPAAAVNAVITATEAKTLALVESGVRAPHGGPASGTATDAIVVAWTGRGARHEYAGPISPVGALIGRAVRQAILASLEMPPTP
jgi:iron complex transport system ATP-binding protein